MTIKILEIDIWIFKGMIGFGPSVKIFNVKYLERGSIVYNTSVIVNMTSEFLYPALANSIK